MTLPLNIREGRNASLSAPFDFKIQNEGSVFFTQSQFPKTLILQPERILQLQDRRHQIHATNEWPYCIHGQAIISFEGGSQYAGSGDRLVHHAEILELNAKSYRT